jgi:hypothetical protein
MVNRKDAIDAASVRPVLRTDAQITAARSDKDSQAVKNADFAAKREERIYGKKDHK